MASGVLCCRLTSPPSARLSLHHEPGAEPHQRQHRETTGGRGCLGRAKGVHNSAQAVGGSGSTAISAVFPAAGHTRPANTALVKRACAYAAPPVLSPHTQYLVVNFNSMTGKGEEEAGPPSPCPTLARLGRSCRIVVYKGPGRGRRGLNRHAGLPKVPDAAAAAFAADATVL